MAREELETLERGYAAANAGDFATLRDLSADDLELRSVFAPGRVFRGRDAIEELYREIAESLVDYRQTAERFLEVGDKVVADVVLEGTGRGSGVPVRQRFATVWSFRAGRVAGAVSYASVEEALQALQPARRAAGPTP